MLVRMPADLLKDSEISRDYKTSVKRKGLSPGVFTLRFFHKILPYIIALSGRICLEPKIRTWA